MVVVWKMYHHVIPPCEGNQSFFFLSFYLPFVLLLILPISLIHFPLVEAWKKLCNGWQWLWIHSVDEEWWLGEAWLTAALFCHPARPKTQHTPSVKVKRYLITVLQIPARHLRTLKLNGLSVFSGWWCGVFLKVCKPTQTIKSFSVGHLCLKSVHSLPAIVRRIKKKQGWLRDCERAFYTFSRKTVR